MTLDEVRRAEALREGFERNLRKAASQHRRLLAALRATGDVVLEHTGLLFTAACLAEFNATLAATLTAGDAAADVTEQPGDTAGSATETGQAA